MAIALVRFEVRPKNVGHFSELFDVSLKAAKKKFSHVYVWNLIGENCEEKYLHLRDLISKYKIDHVHLEWIHDSLEHLTRINELLISQEITWTGTGSVSHLLRGVNRDEKLTHTLRELKSSKVLLGIFIWDDFIVRRGPAEFPKLLELKDYQNIEIDREFISYCCKWKSSCTRPVLGIVGQLYRYRGTDLLIKRFMKFPREPILLAGWLPRSTYSWNQLGILWLGKKLKKILLHEYWINSNKELNHFLTHIDALVIDTDKYPHPSGIVTRARHFGIPVFIGFHDSYLKDLSNFDFGIRQIDLLKTSSLELSRIMEDLKMHPPTKSPSKNDQIDNFIVGWSK
jgi:hypothetical protein